MLPSGCTYALPSAAECPAPRVAWVPTASRAALLIHDMQNYFLRAFQPGTSPLVPLVANISRLRRLCDQFDIPVFYTAQPGNQELVARGLQADFWGPGMTSAPEHQAIVEALLPTASDTVLTKWRYSAFQRSDFEDALRRRGRNQLIVTGVYASIGCALTAADAFMRDVQPFFVIDAVADFSRARHDTAVSYVTERCAVPTTTAGTVTALSTGEM